MPQFSASRRALFIFFLKWIHVQLILLVHVVSLVNEGLVPIHMHVSSWSECENLSTSCFCFLLLLVAHELEK